MKDSNEYAKMKKYIENEKISTEDKKPDLSDLLLTFIIKLECFYTGILLVFISVIYFNF